MCSSTEWYLTRISKKWSRIDEIFVWILMWIPTNSKEFKNSFNNPARQLRRPHKMLAPKVENSNVFKLYKKFKYFSGIRFRHIHKVEKFNGNIGVYEVRLLEDLGNKHVPIVSDDVAFMNFKIQTVGNRVLKHQMVPTASMKSINPNVHPLRIRK